MNKSYVVAYGLQGSHNHYLNFLNYWRTESSRFNMIGIVLRRVYSISLSLSEPLLLTQLGTCS